MPTHGTAKLRGQNNTAQSTSKLQRFTGKLKSIFGRK